MRYFVRDKVLELLSTLKEAIDYINHKALEECLFVMEDMQAGLDSIHNTFQSAFTVATFSKYEEIVRAIEVQLSMVREKKENQQTAYKEVKQIKYFIDQLQTDLLDEAEVKLEVLFIPYKFSMWDSLESIWLAAEADPRCNSRVMPIPYYDRDENGLLADFHYEVDSFMKHDIPVVSYKEYDYTVIQPDVIYYHNPYDGNNRVTSVSPEFYSDKLKHYTNMMVYVPYFVAGNYKGIEKERSFARAPGLINADKVILQSEVLKNVYIELGANPNKMEVLGSPKLDSIYNLEKKAHIPSNWQKLNDKKVTLLNSSIGDFLKENNYLSDLRQNIENILSNDELGLIWRPHPLFETTIKSMKTDKALEYKAIKKLVSAHPNAIIDNNEDMLSAFYFSDALVSDSSSLIYLYIMTGKPVYILYTDPKQVEKTLLYSDYLSCYFEKELELHEFLGLLKEGRDPQGKKRYDNFRKSIINSDGTSGKKIYDCIIKEMEGRTVLN
ncbi:CDP-glycerol glycerophosphotransferase family protein [Ornithinibacillus sp. 4-3]|uniref:CDP-glycerol glycerophosphotransferase family protein n=1 Tax=Ornithinibacillus sp. 4-3 TaxID=3231488 RepID=A0AB39HU22_9BACI